MLLMGIQCCAGSVGAAALDHRRKPAAKPVVMPRRARKLVIRPETMAAGRGVVDGVAGDAVDQRGWPAGGKRSNARAGQRGGLKAHPGRGGSIGLGISPWTGNPLAAGHRPDPEPRPAAFWL